MRHSFWEMGSLNSKAFLSRRVFRLSPVAVVVGRVAKRAPPLHPRSAFPSNVRPHRSVVIQCLQRISLSFCEPPIEHCILRYDDRLRNW